MIPKIIHQFWAGGPFPAEYNGFCGGWQDLHPGWDYHLWNLESFPFSIEDQSCYRMIMKATEISPQASMQFTSDLVRYDLLRQFGGIWIDVDMKPQKPLDSLCVVPNWIAWEDPGRWVNNAVMAAEKGSPWVLEIIRGLEENLAKLGPTVANTHKSGPQYITPVTKRYAKMGVVEIYPKDYFYPYLWNELGREGERFPEAFGVHYWNNRRKRRRT